MKERKTNTDRITVCSNKISKLEKLDNKLSKQAEELNKATDENKKK